MNIKVLIENRQTEEFVSEHGLSFWIEFEGKQYLLDAGASGRFVENAEKMNISLENIQTCILSHGHYDHAGGFATFLEKNQNAKIYAMKRAIEEYYSGSGGAIHSIGIPNHVYPAFEKNFILIDEKTNITDKMVLIPHSTKGLESIGEKTKLYQKEKDSYVPDDFSHELSLVFDTEKGLVIFNSCSHAGIKNIITEVKAVFPDKKLYAFLGGLHMKATKDGQEICTFSEAEILEIANYLEEVGLEKLYTGHCTGEVGFSMLKKVMGDRIEYLNTGKEIFFNDSF